MLASRYSISIGAVRPDACSSSMQSRIDSDWEPIAASAASKGRHLARIVRRENPYKKLSHQSELPPLRAS